MSSISEKTIVLCLDRDWQVIDFKSVRKAITSLISDEETGSGEPQNLALDIDYEFDEDGKPIFENVSRISPVGWDDWQTLPIRPWDLVINSSKRTYRVPTVVVAHNFKKSHAPREFSDRPSIQQILKRDNYTCQITGKQLPREKLNVDHIVAKSRGGKDTWENMIACEKNLNTKKGNRTLEELGLKLIRKPFKPKPSDYEFSIKEPRHVDHYPFLVDKISSKKY